MRIGGSSSWPKTASARGAGDASCAAPPEALSSFEISPEEFARRQAWGSHSGHWQWLWPEVEPSDWRGALRDIERVIREVLADRPAYLAATALGPLSVAAYTSGTGPLLGYWIEQGRIAADTPIARLLLMHLDHNRQRMERLRAVSAELVSQLGADGIVPLVLKGMHTAHAYFPTPETRPMSDIDILVAPDQQQRASEILAASDHEIVHTGPKEVTWIRRGVARTPRSLMLIHADDPWSIDLHRSVDYQPAAGTAFTRLDSEVDQYRVLRMLPIGPVQLLDQPALLLTLASHVGSATSVNLTLLRLTELVLVIRSDRASGRLDWDAFVELAERAGALRVTYPALALAAKLAPDDVPSWVVDAGARASTRIARRVVGELEPAAAQRLDRMSIAEHFMWVRGPRDLARQFSADIWPALPVRQIGARYLRMTWRLMGGAFTR